MAARRNFSLLILLIAFTLNAISSEQRHCLILIDHHDSQENITRPVFYLMSKLQSAIAEQTTPILLDASLWNSFIERRFSFEQNLQKKGSKEQKTFELYQKINERSLHLSNYYNTVSSDVIHNKSIVTHIINEEFYAPAVKTTASDQEYQLLLNYLTPFDAEDWLIYKNSGGFYLLIPKKYSHQHSLTGFKLDSLEKVLYPQDIAYTYFDSQNNQSLVEALPDFFLAYNDSCSPHKWNIVLSGHGGFIYQEENKSGTVTWNGQPFIANLTIQEFCKVLDFFNSQVKTHMFHYSCCYAGGNHSTLIFGEDRKSTYNFPIICGTLTDNTSYCKWINTLPSQANKYLKTTDLSYDPQKNIWFLPIKSTYRWRDFFTCIAEFDFSAGSIESLPKILSAITYPSIADIPLLCLPGNTKFYPLHSPNIIKIDDYLLGTADKDKENAHIAVHGANILLLESTNIELPLILENTESFRFISIKPGHASHYFRKLKTTSYLDLPSAFWQAEYQFFDKTFLLDECTFPYSADSLIFKDLPKSDHDLVLKNVIISQQKTFGIRIFFTLGDIVAMICAYKNSEEDEKATVQEIIKLSAPAKTKYQEYYEKLRSLHK